MNRLWIVLCMIAAIQIEARQGLVTTREGRVFSGQVRLEHNSVVVANAETRSIEQVALTNLLELRLVSSLEAMGTEEGQSDLIGFPEWNTSNIGVQEAVGRTRFQWGAFEITSAGTNVSGPFDSFHFIYQPWKGDGEIVARLLRFQAAHRRAQAGVMMRTDLAPNARHVFLGTSPQGGFVQWRAQDGAWSEQRDNFTLYSWLRLKRSANRFEASTSMDGLRWQTLHRIEMPMEETIQVGLVTAGAAVLPGPRFGVLNSRSLMDQVQVGRYLRHRSFVPRLTLGSGSSVAGDIYAIDDSKVILAGTSTAANFSKDQIARIDFGWMPWTMARKIQSGQPGVLLTSGEFVEGHLKRMENGMGIFSSVLLGLKQFDIHQEVLSIVLRQSSLTPGKFEVKTWSGSNWQGEVTALEPDGIVFEDAACGRTLLPFFDLKELTRRASG